jgi:23S rRNA (uracil1939-C5)-methyltransferase
MNQNFLIKPCPHFTQCSGCVQQPGAYPVIWDEVLQFFKNLNCIPHFHQGKATGWRYRAKIAVRGAVVQPALGLFKRHSHEVVAIPDCVVHHSQLNRAFEKVKHWMVTHQLKPYQEKESRGDIRYVQGVVERATGRVQLSIVVNCAGKDLQVIQQWKAILNQLWELDSMLWHSLWINWNDQATNTIFGSEWTKINGEDLLWECFDGQFICYLPASFGQANLELFERLVCKIKHIVTPQARVTEFYAGVGVIGLCLAAQCEWIRCSEMNPLAQPCFESSRNRLDAETAAKISFKTATTQNTLELMEEATHVIVDPPRKGLDPSFFQALQENQTVKHLIYISCGWEAFQRDCLQLQTLGWKIVTADGYLFFPGSSHIELLAHFSK